MSRIYLNDGWKFTEEFTEELSKNDYDERELTDVRIPHTCKELPFHYFDESEYQMVSGYRRILDIPKDMEGKKLLLTFEGVGHEAWVYINGKMVADHHCGYTAFTVDISEDIFYGSENIIVVKVDSNESINVPPFGFVIDYMTYGGIYRDVYLDVKEPEYIEDVYPGYRVSNIQAKDGIRTGDAAISCKVKISAEALTSISKGKLPVAEGCSVLNNGESASIRMSVRAVGQGEFNVLNTVEILSEETVVDINLSGAILWDTENPALYEVKCELFIGNVTKDEKTVTVGFREAVFKKDGFYLNGRKLRIRGLNRHQSYAYVGYAMPKSMQCLDADILKNELAANAVRTSHYPQSQYFIDRCDEIGLMVFTEIPGWQYIGDSAWKKQAIKNVEEMVIQYRNHPSIILWGVRINESADDDDLYYQTNKVAHELDPYRQTGGVRCIKNSQLLEDVYTYNDFIHDGIEPGCTPKEKVTSDMGKPYMVTEYNGHMYPTKTYDCEEHRLEHSMRHVRVLDAVAGHDDIAGSFAWCMFDYNTHKDFGSGDRICYHGVMDMFRNPKMAAAVYASQQDKEPVLEISSSMDIGEHPATTRGITYAFTNADKVRMYKNDRFIKEYDKKDTPFKNIPHGPIVIDDFVGDVLEKVEGYKHSQAEKIKAILNDVARYGMAHPPKSVYANALKLMAFYHMKYDDVSALYTKYVGDWGGAATEYKFEALKDGRVVKTVVKSPAKKISLMANADHVNLCEKVSYDVALIRIKAVDEWENTLPFFNDPVALKCEGDIKIIGPKMISLQGGMGGTYVKTTGKEGKGVLRIKAQGLNEVVIDFEITVE